jgi:hypothetical protein
MVDAFLHLLATSGASKRDFQHDQYLLMAAPLNLSGLKWIFAQV